MDIILTTEPYDAGTGECLHRPPLRWFAAKDSAVFTARPLPIAYERKCIFMPLVVRAGPVTMTALPERYKASMQLLDRGCRQVNALY